MDIKHRKRPTLKTLSEVTGFAVTTVSRALRNESEININTRLKIQKAAEEVGYQPDRAAQRLRGGSALSIGLILDQSLLIAEFERRIISGIASVIYSETQHNLVVFPQPAGTSPIEAVRHLVDHAQVDGLIFTNTMPQDDRVRYLLDRNMPFVTYGRSEFQVQHPYVDFDNYAFTKLAVQRLAQKGRTKLAMVPSASNLTCAGHLMRGFEETAADLKLEARLVPDLFLDSTHDTFRDVAIKLADEQEPPDGIICGTELGAIAMAAGLRSAGFKLGQDIDIIAKSTSDLLDYETPSIDSYHENIAGAGETLARFLVSRFKDEPVANLQAIVQPELRDRTSTP